MTLCRVSIIYHLAPRLIYHLGLCRLASPRTSIATAGAQFGINKSWKIQLESIIPTIYSDEVCKSLMLESLSEDDINEAIKSLSLTTEGTPEEVLTADDYKKHTQ